jgi:thiol-disulfide isomerase/thioredoxin
MLKAGENVDINFLDSTLTNNRIKGGAIAADQNQFWTEWNLADKKSSQIIAAVTENNHAAKGNLEKIVDSIRNGQLDLFYKRWILAHPNSPFSTCVLRLFAFHGTSMKKDTVAENLYDHLSFAAKKDNVEATILLNMFTMTNPAKYEKEYLNSLGKESDQTVQSEEKVERYKVPDFRIKDTLGNEISLSALRGSYVLMDFWASWCKPCRANMPFIKEIYNNYSQKKLIVLSVSADESKEKWMKAIRDEQMTWLNGSDLLGTDKGVVKKYQIGFFPQYFLIDPDGYSIQRSRSNLNAIRTQLAEMFDVK